MIAIILCGAAVVGVSVGSTLWGWAQDTGIRRALGLVGSVLGILVIGLSWARAPRPASAWTLPANPTVMPVWTPTGQEMVFDAATYPVAVVRLTDTAALARLNQAWAAPSPTPHRLGFVAVVSPQPLSVTAVVHRLAAAHLSVPWGLVIDPPRAYEEPGVQLFLPDAGSVRRVSGSRVWAAWAQAVRPLPPPPVIRKEEIVHGHRA